MKCVLSSWLCLRQPRKSNHGHEGLKCIGDQCVIEGSGPKEIVGLCVFDART